MTIDTLEYVKKLEAAGVVQDLATKHDLQTEVQRLELKFQSLEARVQLLTWMIGFNLAATMAILWKLLR